MDIYNNQNTKNFKNQCYVISVLAKKTKAGKDYISGKLKCKTGVMRYNVWDNFAYFIDILKPGKYFEVEGMLEEYNQEKQVNVKNVVLLDDKDVNVLDFKAVSIFSLNELLEEFNKIIDSFTDEFIIFLAKEMITKKFIENFANTPAAKNVHGAWVGGLLEHAVSVAKLSDFIVNYYNPVYFNNKINRDIVIFASLFHDLGKMWEYDYSSPEIEVTKVGELLGHLYLSAQKISNLAKNYTGNDKDEKLMKLLHVILSHHGKLEWGAPVTPKIPEAVILHYMDNVDAKLMNIWENLKDCREEFTKRNFVHENARLYNILLD